MKYDVVVVGGRISGSIASLYASKQDVNVLMIEKNQEIGTPVQCAGGVTRSFFETLQMKPPQKLICSEIEGAILHAPDGEKFLTKNSLLQGYILERKMLDKALAIKSAEAGTDIMLKAQVKDLIIEKGQVKGVIVRHQGKLLEIPSKIVIGADGVESQVARMAGLHNGHNPQDLISCAQYEMVGLDIDPEILEFYFGFNKAPGGYVWIFPKGENRANVGLGVRYGANSAIYYLNKFISHLKGKIVELNVGGVPIGGPLKKTYSHGVLLTGDAAGHVDPVTGGGMHLSAVCSSLAGKIAAEAVINENLSSSYLSRYEKEWKKRIGKNLQRSLKYRALFDNMDDEELNSLIKFLNTNDFKSLSTLSILKLAREYPKLFLVLKNIL
ncbi:MAG: NAD(P)/FAD-dependent oxidoreductase [Euryarchaeota archaeon]|nr:NAD(P)/FAD-dependent oxidoreductase [Euryarchaeota archaeon]MBU4607666.1 NAD(P)/FAD-dependent oxidoreductase [Euryarchaeota archaeon]MBV1730457.1 NAD(P)/FAD-dependent oxidoreductase [Methanobacterium sp.]MBV1755722.1 NAD(P)/FAD-dependent oxidoreductase [Methanobacterium sp.]